MRDGKIRAIGVSNFLPSHLEALKKIGMVLVGDLGGRAAQAVFKKRDNVTVKFSYPSVGATENCIFASVLGDGCVVLKIVRESLR